ncbi:DEAD/DEAH box helicase family protein [Moraxella canis]|uniref:DEAD/DEAH box helicase family protein n=1 Tax=Moraxella canis TaxID=90239 RepID=UPI001D0CEE96|nr:DEAD/DEAH box helicase family protein [Moraxella canis]
MFDFTELSLKSVYTSESDNLYMDFYRPVLEKSIRYDRAVGYFSSEILKINLKGLSRLLYNKGKMRLIIGDPLSSEEYQAIQSGSKKEKESTVDFYLDKLLQMIDEDESSTRLEILALLIASNSLEIKFAIRRQGMYHSKIGIVYDENKNCIVFQGSANETRYALLDDLNSESISVYKSWEEQIFLNYGQHYIDEFERLWRGESKHTYILDVTSRQYQRIAEHIAKKPKSKSNNHTDILQILMENDDSVEYDLVEFKQKLPQVPATIGGQQFKIRNHQRMALNSWKANSYKGILKHATGSGKTITSIYALTKIFEAKYKKNQPLVAIISVPYIELAKQWIKELALFNIVPVQCFESRVKWSSAVSRNINLLRQNRLSFLCLLTVNKTLISEEFQRLIVQIPKDALMLIGDECHRHAAKNTYDALPDAYFRLGLSATPFEDDDDEIETHSLFPDVAKERLLSYYQNIVHEYTLSDAIHDGVLTPYDYQIVPVYLTQEEQVHYDELSFKIEKIIVQANGHLSKEEQERLMIHSSERSRLLGRAKNKLTILDQMTKDVPDEDKAYTLFYTGEGKADEENTKVIDEAARILSNNHWRVSQFTGATSAKDRKESLDAFKLAKIDALVAMKVLDEGIDVPACRTAYILASSKNPRQYVQRRGRVLRRFQGKDKATIYDFVVLPNQETNSVYGSKLKEAELVRIRDFAQLANNKADIENLIDKLEMNHV